MISFFDEIADYIVQKHRDNLKDICFVFPGRRAILFFRKALVKQFDKPVFSPKMITISELFQSNSGKPELDKIGQLFYLHQIYSEVTKSEVSFDDFIYWGEVLLKDFEDIDKNLIDAKDLFRNLGDLKSIDNKFDYLDQEQVFAIKQFWRSFDSEKLGQHQQRFADIWNSLFDIYTQFSKKLNENNSATSGMIQREVSGRENEILDYFSDYKQIVIVGFNALTKAEKRVFKHLSDLGKTIFFWDYDPFYVENQVHEAGFFIRENLQKFPQPKDFFSSQKKTSSFKKKKSVNLFETSTNIASAEVAMEVLKEIQSKTNGSTAVVLPDESILPMLLSKLPEIEEGINITMGYSLSSTPVYSLIQSMHKLILTSTGSAFYYKDLIRFFNNQYLYDSAPVYFKKLTESILQSGKMRLSLAELKQFSSENHFALDLVFKEFDSYLDFSESLKVLILNLTQHFHNDDEQSLEFEYLYKSYLIINRLCDLFKEYDLNPGIETWLRILKKYLYISKVDFIGEPLTGIQFMGLLETRSLDFDNIIVLSVNEGVLPSKRFSNSFIPYSIRKAFDLATNDYSDSISAYYFYSLIQRSENVNLIYNSSTDFSSSGEVSRYMKQLEYETDWNIVKKTVDYDFLVPKNKEISFERTDEVQLKIQEFFKDKYLSPSALISYLDCSLRFYLKYINGIEEPVIVENDINPRVFGNILHSAMAQLYSVLKDDIYPNDLKSLLSDKDLIRSSVNEAFIANYFPKNKKPDNLKIAGRHILVLGLIEKYIRRIIETDIKRTPFKIITLEGKHKKTIKLSDPDYELEIGGIIDRIESREGVLHILDYKTGNGNSSFSDIPGLFEREKNKRAKEILQALIYCWLYSDTKVSSKILKPGLIFMKNLHSDDFSSDIYFNKTMLSNYAEIHEEFEHNLKASLNELIFGNEAISQTQNTDICRNCEFRNICSI